MCFLQMQTSTGHYFSSQTDKAGGSSVVLDQTIVPAALVGNEVLGSVGMRCWQF